MIEINSYRIGVGIILLNEEKKVFVGKRIDIKSEFWQMPQGGINKNEKMEDAAYRELYEETGIKKAKIILRSKKWFQYNIPLALKKKLWKGKYLGQKQKWYVFKFNGNDKEINLKTKKPEFLEWKWIDLEIITDTVVDFKLEIYKKIKEEVKKIIN